MEYFRTVEEWQVVLGENIRNTRLQRNLDQRDLAAHAGVALNAVKRLESGQAVTTTTLIRVVRTLDRTDWLDSLAPEVSVNPMQPGKIHGPRKRIFSERKKGHMTSDNGD